MIKIEIFMTQMNKDWKYWQIRKTIRRILRFFRNDSIAIRPK